MLKKLAFATLVAGSLGGAILAFAKPASATEEVTFEYGSLQVEYTTQGADGGDNCVLWFCW
jgi:hypothetical protein